MHTCKRCGKEIIGRRDAVYCSPECRSPYLYKKCEVCGTLIKKRGARRYCDNCKAIKKVEVTKRINDERYERARHTKSVARELLIESFSAMQLKLWNIIKDNMKNYTNKEHEYIEKLEEDKYNEKQC